MAFEAVTTTANIPNAYQEVPFGSLTNNHNYFDAYIDFLTNVGQKVKLLIYVTSATGGVRSLAAQSDWLIADSNPVRAIKALQFTAGSLFELQVIADGVCNNIKCSLVGYESQENFVPPDTSTNTVALVQNAEVTMATITNPHSFFDANAEYIAVQGVRVRWTLYATAGAGGVRAKVVQFCTPPATQNNQKMYVLQNIGPIGANTFELTAFALDPVGSTPNVKASLDGFDPIKTTIQSQSVSDFIPAVVTLGALVNNANLNAYDISAGNNNGIALTAGSIVILQAQTTSAENGPYVVGTVTAGFAPLTRPDWWKTGMTIPGIQICQIVGDGVSLPTNLGYCQVALIPTSSPPNNKVGTSGLNVLVNTMKGTVALVAGTATVTLPAKTAGAAGASSHIQLVDKTAAAAVKGVFGGGGTTLVITGTGADTIDWGVQNW